MMQMGILVTLHLLLNVVGSANSHLASSTQHPGGLAPQLYVYHLHHMPMLIWVFSYILQILHRKLWPENRMGVIHAALHLQNVLISVSDFIFLGLWV
jgi:hypothetical protein